MNNNTQNDGKNIDMYLCVCSVHTYKSSVPEMKELYLLQHYII